MQGLDLSIKILGDIPLARATETLIEALDEPSPEVRKEAFDCLLGRRWDEAAPRLVARYARLDNHQRSRMLERHEEIIPHLREILETGRYDEKCNAIQMISEVGKIRLLHLLTPVFSGIDERVRRRAGQVLMEAVASYMDLTERASADPAGALAEASARSRKELSALLTALLRSYPSHREECVLRGLLALGNNCHRLLMSVFAQGNERTATDLVKILQTPETEQWDVFLARMFLDKEEFVRNRADFVLKKRGPETVRRVIRHIFLIANLESITALSRWWGEEIWWKDVREHLDHYEAAVQEKIYAIMRAGNTKSENADACMGKLARSDSPEIRRKVVEDMTARRNPDIETLVDLLQDPDEQVQLSTTRYVLESDHPRRTELVIRQLLSEHESVRKMASREVSKYSFRAYMRAFDSLGDRTRSLAASALAKIDGDLDDELSRALAAAEADTKMKALKIATLSRVEQKLEPLIITLASDSSPFVRATALLALTRYASEKAEEVILNALRDPDARVVANAIEALELMDRKDCLPRVKEFMHSPIPRVRGNVVRFLYRFGDEDYRNAFLEMCGCADRHNHATAIWLAESLDMPEAEEGLMTILRGRSDPQVHARAAGALNRIRAGNQKEDAPLRQK